MGITISEHVILILSALLLGFILGVIYEVLRIIRTYFGNGRALIFVFDVLFWIIAGVLTYWFFLIFNEGKFRITAFVFEILGALLYYFTVGKVVIKYVRESNARVKKNIKKATIAVAKPVSKYSKVAGKEIMGKSRIVGDLFKKDCKDVNLRLKHGGKVLYNYLQPTIFKHTKKKD